MNFDVRKDRKNIVNYLVIGGRQQESITRLLAVNPCRYHHAADSQGKDEGYMVFDEMPNRKEFVGSHFMVHVPNLNVDLQLGMKSRKLQGGASRG